MYKTQMLLHIHANKSEGICPRYITATTKPARTPDQPGQTGQLPSTGTLELVLMASSETACDDDSSRSVCLTPVSSPSSATCFQDDSVLFD